MTLFNIESHSNFWNINRVDKNQAEIVKKVHGFWMKGNRPTENIPPASNYYYTFAKRALSLLNMPKKKPGSGHKWEDSGGHSPLGLYFNSVHPLSPAAFTAIDEQTYPVEVAKGKFLLKPGSMGDSLYLIMKGVVRAYIIEDGKEITTWINEENEIVGTIRNLGLNIPSDEHLQAIETCQLIAIPYSLVEYLYEHFPEANIIGRKLLEASYRDAEERAYISRIPSAEKKYRRFVERRSQLANRVALKYIASYLGMTLETLSRIRNKRSL